MGIRQKGALRRFMDRTFRGEKMGIGAYMWAMHRITGIILVFYLFLHLFILSKVLAGPEPFNQVMRLFSNPFVRLLELVLVWVALFHGMNGVRLILLHLFPELNQRRLAYAFSAFTVIGVLVSLPLFLQ